MPILPPGLDDRRFDDLVEDLIARIPAHTPEWTNPRLGDPGRTLIELFAWLGDTLLYRANLIPERQRLAFLSLLGIGLEAGAGGDRHRQPVLRTADRAARDHAAARRTRQRARPVRDAGRNDGAADLRRGVHQADADRRRGDRGRRSDHRPRPHSPDQRRRPRATRPCRCSTRAGPSPAASTCSPRAPTTRCGSRSSRLKHRGRTSSWPSTTTSLPRSAAATPAHPR